MAKGNIYWFTGLPTHGKTVLGKKLVELLQTERRNWRKDVFHLDEDDLITLTLNKNKSEQEIIDNVRTTQVISEFLHNNGCDVVVSLTAPYRWLREEFKEKIGSSSFQEFYVYHSELTENEYYETPEQNFFEVNTTKDNPEQSFTKIVNYLREVNKL